MKKRWGLAGVVLFQLIKVGVAGLSGYLFNILVQSPAPGTEWMFGGIVFLMLHGWEEMERRRRNYEKHEKALLDMGARIADATASRSLMGVALTYHGKALNQADLNKAWRQLSWFAEKSYHATNFIEPKSFYEGNAKDVVNLQLAKKRTDPSFDIQKVFIWRDEKERNSDVASNIFRLHREDANGELHLRQVLISKIRNDSSAKELLAELDDHIDFAVFDAKVVLIWQLNQRQVTGGRVEIGEQTVEGFIALFREIRGLADKCEVVEKAA